MTLAIRVTGTPGPQGSHRGFVVNGRAIVTHDSARTRPWRQDVKTAALDALGDQEPLTGPVSLRVCFYMPRPKAHYNTAGNVKPTAPNPVAKRPDIDKLLRSTIDALTEAGVFRDDAQIAHLVARKCYTSGAPGAFIEVERCA